MGIYCPADEGGAIVADVRIPMNLLLHKWRWVKFSLFYQDGGHWLSSLIGHYERRNKVAVFAQNSKQWKNSTIVAKMCYGIILELRWRFGHWLANPLTQCATDTVSVSVSADISVSVSLSVSADTDFYIGR